MPLLLSSARTDQYVRSVLLVYVTGWAGPFASRRILRTAIVSEWGATVTDLTETVPGQLDR